MISLGMLRVRKTRAHWSNLSPRNQKKRLKNYRFSLFVHGTDEERPVHMRVSLNTTLFELGVRLWKQSLLPPDFFETVSAWTRSSGFLSHRIGWADTVGQHGFGSLSLITLSVPILGGTGDEMNVETKSLSPSLRPDLLARAVETKPSAGHRPSQIWIRETTSLCREKKRKRAAPSKRTSKRKPDGDDAFESDGRLFIDEDGNQDEESDSEVEVLVDNSELAEGLASKTIPNPMGARKGKGKEKENDNAGAKPRKKKRRVANEPEKVIEPVSDPYQIQSKSHHHVLP
ncbi:hypothetical protein K438DRAFT_332620 [Mycena galopus ATCC 62051]|nr:hypothetical protein K438DRAFT_332620 [Mycena galopus ATCC 62051]